MFKFGLIIEALEDFRECISLDPEKAQPYFNAAICLINLGVPEYDFEKKKLRQSKSKIDIFNSQAKKR